MASLASDRDCWLVPVSPGCRQCLERSLAIYEQTYNSRHPDVAHALTNLGATWRSLGDSLRSKELFEQALAIQEELFEPQHPAVSTASTSYSK